MSQADVEQYEIDEQPDEVNEPELILVEAEPVDETQGELIKFALLAVVLLGTALVIGLLRPYIFDQIIPAVLGEDMPSATIINTEIEAETLKPEVEAEDQSEDATDAADSVEDAASATETSDDSEAEVTEEEDAPAIEEPVNPEDFPTAVPAQTHTVQPGETLTAIARQYGVTVQAIVQANQITNPNRVDAGTVLTIPEGQ